MAGSTTSLLIAIGGTTIGLVTGVTLGAVAGLAGGWTDNILMRLVDILLAIPAILLALVVVAVLGAGTMNLVAAVAVFSVPGFARISRGSVLAVREREFILAARCLGASDVRVLWHHLLPNTLAPIIVQATLRTATAIFISSSLSFLGLGAQPPAPEWGRMLSEARGHLESSPHVAIFPGLTIAMAVLGFNLLGDGVSDALDPRSELLRSHAF